MQVQPLPFVLGEDAFPPLLPDVDSSSSYGSSKSGSSVSESMSSSSSSPVCGPEFNFSCPQPNAEVTFVDGGCLCNGATQWQPATLINTAPNCHAQSAMWGGISTCPGGFVVLYLYPEVTCVDGQLVLTGGDTGSLRLVGGVVTGTASWALNPFCRATVKFNGG